MQLGIVYNNVIILRLTQQYMCDKLDITQNHYSRIENGHVGMSFNILLQLFKF